MKTIKLAISFVRAYHNNLTFEYLSELPFWHLMALVAPADRTFLEMEYDKEMNPPKKH